ncbi:transposable element Tc1 transposase [Trichonephila clavipes]|nr:transposable element Tc1 transposase [Trichonephila clavipes]
MIICGEFSIFSGFGEEGNYGVFPGWWEISVYKASKLSLKKYDLKSIKILDCIMGSFCLVRENKNLGEEDVFQCLPSSLKPITKARDIAESYPPSKDNYLKVSDHLKSRYGRKDFLIEVDIRDLLAIVNTIYQP